MNKYKVTESNGYKEWTVGQYNLLDEARAVAKEGLSGHPCTIWRQRPRDEAASKKGTWQVWSETN